MIYSTEPIPNDVVAVRAGAPAELDEQLGNVLDHMSLAIDGNRALRQGFIADGFVQGSDADFNPVRELMTEIEASK